MRLARLSLICLIVLAAIGALYEQYGRWHDVRRFPQRGRSYPIGAIHLNLNCTGQGSPTVILESGLGGGALDWIRVQPDVAAFTRVCSYDRAGYGASDVSTEPRDSLHIAKELHTLLQAAHEPAPYLLVGHSMGGYHIRTFTSLYPHEVTGLVLVDASHPDEEARINQLLPADIRARQKQQEASQARWHPIRRFFRKNLGLQRLALATGWEASPYVPRDIQQELFYLEQQPKYKQTVAAENAQDTASGTQATAAGSLGDRPLIVLTAGRPYGPDPEPFLTPQLAAAQDNLWINILQKQEAQLSTRSRQIVVPDSTHDMPTDRPDAIVSAIREVIALLR